MLWEHRVLTSHQVTALAFPSFRSGRQRLRELYLWGVVDRFQPFVTVGTAPMHYVLAPAGATVLAAEDGRDVKEMGYRHDRAFAVAHSLRLAHTVGVNEWFTTLVARARHEPGALTAWWSETRCSRHFGDLVRPDAYGRWQQGDRQIEWFLEYDFGTEPLAKLARETVRLRRPGGSHRHHHPSAGVAADLAPGGQRPPGTRPSSGSADRAAHRARRDRGGRPARPRRRTPEPRRRGLASPRPRGPLRRRTLAGLADAWPGLPPPVAADDTAPGPVPPPPRRCRPRHSGRRAGVRFSQDGGGRGGRGAAHSGSDRRGRRRCGRLPVHQRWRC
ncbi:replication-relaxation family protein [Amycolatopsis endophytica]|uniref:replication-relaxation family protein n=1 Tax=Amycolatopsis endophytica TaxID=860233 RepID=UPI00406BAE2F